MIEIICTHILDLLQIPAVFAGGNAYTAGWAGYSRNSPQQGYVNLLDRVYEEEDTTFRPAVYVGSRTEEADDQIDFVTCSGGSPGGSPIVEYRRLTVPLLISVRSKIGMKDARNQRNQLRANIRAILWSHRIEPGYWYLLEIPGISTGTPGIGDGSIARDRVWTSGAPSGVQGSFEGMAALPLIVHYSLTGSSSA